MSRWLTKRKGKQLDKEELDALICAIVTVEMTVEMIPALARAVEAIFLRDTVSSFDWESGHGDGSRLVAEPDSGDPNQETLF